MKLNPLVFVCVMLLASTCWSSTYYVSSSTGSDANNGVTASSPWKTVAKVNSVTFLPGDVIRFKRGDVWRETLNPKTSGAYGSPIVFGTYDTGNRPSIRGSNDYSSTGNWVSEGGNTWYIPAIVNDPGIFAHDGMLGHRKLQKSSLSAQWDYWFDNATSRLYVYSTANPAMLATTLEVAVRKHAIGPQWAGFITFDNLDVRHGYSAGWLGWGAQNVSFSNCNFTQSGGDHILFHNGSNNGLVANSTFDDWGGTTGQYYAVHTQGYGTASTGPVDIRDCRFTATGAILQPAGTEHTVIMQDLNSWIRNVQRNVIDGSSGIKDDGIVIWDSSASATFHVIESNTIKGIGGIAIAVQQLENNGGRPAVSLRYNRIENVSLSNALDKSAIRLRDFSSASSVLVSYNTVNGTQQGANSSPGIDISRASGAKIYNNTIYGADNGITIRNGSLGSIAHNNILFFNRKYAVEVDATSSLSADYNCLSSNASGGYSGIPQGAHDVANNPLTVNAASGDFRLTTGSPCRDKGTNVGLTEDIVSTRVPSGTGWDIGAFEFPVLTIVPPRILGIM